MGEEGEQVGVGLLREVGADEILDDLQRRIIGELWVKHGIDAALLGLWPALGPVGIVEFPVGAEADVGRQRAGEEGRGGVDGVGGAGGLYLVGIDAGVGRCALEVRDKNGVGIRRSEAGAGVVGDAGRAVLNVADRGQQIGGLFGMPGVPELLGVPRAGGAPRGMLVSDPPAAVAVFHEVHEPFLVALVGVVVAGEQVAVFVEEK